jgi:biopolymer transport protein TolR
MQNDEKPITVSIKADGSIFVNETQTPYDSLSPALLDMAGNGLAKPIYVRADGRASYAVVAQVMAALSTSGFTSINLITDTGGPSSGLRDDARGGAPATP